MAKKRIKSGPEAYHHGDLKKSLIKTAIRMLQKTHPEKLSLRELARQAGVSPAAPYRHFHDKIDLIAQIMEEGFELKYQYMREALLKSKGHPREMFFSCGMAYFKMGLLHPQHFRLMVSSEIQDFQAYPSLEQAALKSFLLLRATIEYGQKKKFLGPGDASHRAMNCWCVVNGFTSLYAEGRLTWLGVNKDNAEEAIRVLMSQLLNGSKVSLGSSEFGFVPFKDAKGGVYKQKMLTQPHSEIEAIFSSFEKS